MIEQLRARVLDARTPDRQREVGLRKQLNTATEQVNTWYALVEEGKMPLHDSLRERLESAQRRIDSMTLELAEMAKRRQLPFKKIGDAQIAAFADAVRAEVLNPQSKLAKGYLKALVREVRVGPTGGVMLGSTADMAAAASNWRESDPTAGKFSVYLP